MYATWLRRFCQFCYLSFSKTHDILSLTEYLVDEHPNVLIEILKRLDYSYLEIAKKDCINNKDIMEKNSYPRLNKTLLLLSKYSPADKKAAIIALAAKRVLE